MDGLTCPHCGSAIEDGSATCSVCGAAVKRASTPQQASPPYVLPQVTTPAGPATTPTSPSMSNVPSADGAPAGQQQSGGYSYPAYGGGSGTAYGQPAYGSPTPPAQPLHGYPTARIPGKAPEGAMPAAPVGAPGYPAYPQGYAYPNSSSSSYSPSGYYPYPYTYGYGYGYPWGYYYPVYVRPRRARGETLALVVSWIVTFAGGLSILCGLLLSLIVLLAISQGLMDNLTEQTVFTGVTLGPIVGGGFAIYFGIRGIMRRPSPRFSLPNPWIFAALTALVLAAGVILWYTSPAPGPAVAVLPLVLASGVLPALAILSFTSWRLRMPTTRRHVWMSFFYGLTLAPLLAIIFELVASILFALLLSALGHNVPSALANPSSANPNDPVTVVLLLLSLSVAAPVIEEGVKPLGAVLLMRRLRTPASAFLMGMAAGIGFDMLETIGYIGQGEADWVGVAIGRIGAGLLHGVGAGMAALGWYYLINGKGVRLRWLRGFGGIAYAMAQHAIFNGSNLLSFLPGPIGTWMQQPAYLGRLPLDGGILLFFAYYIAIFGVLIYVTGRLVRAPDGSTAELTTGGPGLISEGEREPREPTPVGSGAR